VNQFLAIAVGLGIFAVGVYSGIAIYAYRVRLRLAFSVLRGHTKIDGCAKIHVPAQHEIIKSSERKALQDANTQLTIARGLICFMPAPVQQGFKDTVNEIVHGERIHAEIVTPD
jgi:hypothetical protein